MKKLILLLLLFGVYISAQDSLTNAPTNAKRFYKRKAVPTSSTNECTGDCWIGVIQAANHSGSDRTFTVTDAQGSPITSVPTVTIADKSVFMKVFPGGEFFPSGCKWVASGSGVDGYLFGANR